MCICAASNASFLITRRCIRKNKADVASSAPVLKGSVEKETSFPAPPLLSSTLPLLLSCQMTADVMPFTLRWRR